MKFLGRHKNSIWIETKIFSKYLELVAMYSKFNRFKFKEK